MDSTQIKKYAAQGYELLRVGANAGSEWARARWADIQAIIEKRREAAMAMKRCESGHYFDAGKSSECPMCKSAREGAAPVSAGEAGGMPQKIGRDTVAVMMKDHGVDPVVGWLVCIKGPDKGRDYRIRAEKNFIGRAAQMDISLAQDETISRENHATIIFTPKKKNFKLIPGESRGLIYVNGEEVLSPTDLRKGDAIDIGKSQLLFVPFVGDMFDWEETSEYHAPHSTGGKSSARAR